MKGGRDVGAAAPQGKSMKPRGHRSLGQAGDGNAARRPASALAVVVPLLGLVPLVLAGCVSGRASVEKNLLNDKHTTSRHDGVAEQYRVACPDVLEIRLDGSTRRCPIEADGRVDLGTLGRVRVEGKNLQEVAEVVARAADHPPSALQVRVLEYRSRVLLLFGQVVGWQRTVPYQGQETVLDVLQRVGGITVGAAPEDVHVVRTHIGDGKRPEIFHVDLQAIVMKKDESTNIRLQPFDQIYVGETRQSRVERILPRWLRPMHRAFWNTRPDRKARENEPSRAPHRWIQGKDGPPILQVQGSGVRD